MSHAETVATLGRMAGDAFGRFQAWLDHPIVIGRARPDPGGWGADQVAEHVTLTNHYLLLTLAKWAAIAERRAARGDLARLGPDQESDLDRVGIIAVRGRFAWPHPAHMTPADAPDLAEVRRRAAGQFANCAVLLDRLDGGVGALATVRMSVADLGRLDLYQWLAFLLRHMERHDGQLADLAAAQGTASFTR